MGENLVLNMESRGFDVAVFNRSVEKVDTFVNGRGLGKKIIGTHSVEELINSLASPRKVMLMVKAGKPVDDFIEQLIPWLDKGDIIIDGGNSHYPDTTRRTRYVESKGLLYVGAGVSGGEEGALKGPSIMPGGSREAWESIKPIFQSVAAIAKDNKPCCEWMGEEGAGHFVKMVHNGIEYGDMQLICESYSIMKDLLGMSEDEMHDTFSEWNKRDLNSYLIEITADILAYRDEGGEFAVNKILDTAGQKGTGKWTAISAMELGVPLTLIGESVFARFLSALKDDRITASKTLVGPDLKFSGDKKTVIKDLEQALFASKIISYAQGYALLQAAAKEYSWNLDYRNISLIWRGGCIIRSSFLDRIAEAYVRDPKLMNLVLDSFFKEKIETAQHGWRAVVSNAVMNGLPVPALSSALSYYDGIRSENLPANLLQAQRDYFGAHTYERIDQPRGSVFHTNWTGEGGDTTSSTYDA